MTKVLAIFQLNLCISTRFSLLGSEKLPENARDTLREIDTRETIPKERPK